MARIPENSPEGIDTMLVAQTIGLNSNDFGELCSGRLINEPTSVCRINVWSKYKPINSTIFPHTQEMRNKDFGFNVTPSLPGIPGIIYYDLPKEADNAFFCLDDYAGYNHDAVPCTAKIQDTTFVDAPEGTNIYIGASDTVAIFYVYVVLPEFEIHLLKNGNYKTITVTDGKVGTPDFNETVGSYTLQPGEISKQIAIQCSQRNNLPGKGGQAIRSYYVTFGNAYWLNTDYMKLRGVIYRQMVVDVNDPTQWHNVWLEDPGNLIGQGGTRYDSWTYFYGDGKQTSTRVRIYNLVVTSAVAPLRVWYMYQGQWFLYETLNSTISYREIVLTGKANVSNWKIDRKFA